MEYKNYRNPHYTSYREDLTDPTAVFKDWGCMGSFRYNRAKPILITHHPDEKRKMFNKLEMWYINSTLACFNHKDGIKVHPRKRNIQFDLRTIPGDELSMILCVLRRMRHYSWIEDSKLVYDYVFEKTSSNIIALYLCCAVRSSTHDFQKSYEGQPSKGFGSLSTKEFTLQGDDGHQPCALDLITPEGFKALRSQGKVSGSFKPPINQERYSPGYGLIWEMEKNRVAAGNSATSYCFAQRGRKLVVSCVTVKANPGNQWCTLYKNPDCSLQEVLDKLIAVLN